MNKALVGRDALRQAIEKTGGGRFLKVKDGEVATIRFLQELDEDGNLYDETRGTAKGFMEHVHPVEYTKSFLCTVDDGRCLGCELVATNPRWRAKGRIFFNVLLRNNNGEDEVKIYAVSMSKKGLAPQIVDYADENGTLCDRDYKLKRTGAGKNDTVYTLTPRAPSPLKATEEALELVDFNTVIKDLDYDQQVELVNGGDDNEAGGW